MGLNVDQQAVVDNPNGVIALVAGPGSGKTATLVARHKALLASGIRAEEILNLTFTKYAAEEMKKRAGGVGDFLTFHSFGYRVISEMHGRPPVEPELQHRLLSRLVRKYRLDYKEFTAFISTMRHQSISPTQAMGEMPYGAPQAYDEYERERKAAGWIDFDSMVMDSLALLASPATRMRYQYRYVSIDEAPDTDLSQWGIAKHITETYGNVLAVGDKNQAMYGFRNAVVDFESRMKSLWPSVQTRYLGVNYRSTKTLVSFIRENVPEVSPLTDKMTPARSNTGVPVQFRMDFSEANEVKSTMDAILRDCGVPCQGSLI
jgi:DNA helicase-2/ATP-dependent DNA helicase PcrA